MAMQSSFKDILDYYHNDHLGTPLALSDKDGVVVAEWKRDPFGMVVSKTGSVDDNNMFPGQVWDADAGLAYNWNRWYSPEIGRYVEVDPIGLAGGPNPYLYVDANPLSNLDARGLLSSAGALLHYIRGDGKPLSMSIGDIDTSSIKPSEMSAIIEALKDPTPREVMIDSNFGFSTSGDAALYLGNITLRAVGKLKIEKCGWCFNGQLRSFSDIYDFNASFHRTAMGELSTGIGRQFPGTAFRIDIAGSKSLSECGKCK